MDESAQDGDEEPKIVGIEWDSEAGLLGKIIMVCEVRCRPPNEQTS